MPPIDQPRAVFSPLIGPFLPLVGVAGPAAPDPGAPTVRICPLGGFCSRAGESGCRDGPRGISSTTPQVSGGGGEVEDHRPPLASPPPPGNPPNPPAGAPPVPSLPVTGTMPGSVIPAGAALLLTGEAPTA
ncbi:hypothetical protein Pen01_29740 [Phytomonospora endophytica]|nr:hypothetical protein Pen01_29740 [Phytomonospora endophytica]